MEPGPDILAVIAERTANAVVLCGADRRVRWVNAGFTRITGYQLEEVLGKVPGKLLQGPGTDAGVILQMRQALDAGEPVTVEVVNYRKGGEPYRNHLEILPLHDAQGVIEGFLALQRDVTAEVKAEERTRRHEVELARRLRNFTAVQAVAHSGAWELDHRTGTLWWSDEVYRIFGLEVGVFEVSYPAFLAAVHPEDRALVDRAFTASVRDRIPYDIRHRVVLPDGRLRWVREYCITDYGPDGQPQVSVGTVQDITDQVAAAEDVAATNRRLDQQVAALSATQQELRQREVELSEALSCGGMGTWSLDVATGLFHFTEEFYRIFRTTTVAEGGPTMTIPAYAERFLPPEVQPLVAEAAQAALMATEPDYRCVLDHPVIFADGSPGHIQVSFRVVRDATGAVVRLIGVNQDISERMAQMRALAEARDHAEAALHAKTDFLGTISHEIRTPMNGILGMLDLLRTGLPPGDHQDFATLGHGSAQRLLVVLNDIIDHARLKAGSMAVERAPYDLAVVVLDVIELFRLQAEQQGLHLHADLGPGPWKLVGDGFRVRQILANLVGNAVKFTQAGRITVRLERRFEGLVVQVSDTGIGIPATALAHLFEPFHQVDQTFTRRFGGSGLGLAISRNLADLMGGQLTVTSEPGVGSTFMLHLPWGQACPDTTTTPNGLTVLVAEDDAVNRLMVAKMLTRLGYRPECVADGGSALERLAQGGIDVVLMDYLMPIMNGAEVTRRWRVSEARTPGCHLPIIALTACVLPSDREACLSSGMDAFLAKPINREILAKALADHLSPSFSRALG